MMSKNLLRKRIEDLETWRIERKARKKARGDARQIVNDRINQLAERMRERIGPDELPPLTLEEVRAEIAQRLPQMREYLAKQAAMPKYPENWHESNRKRRKA